MDSRAAGASFRELAWLGVALLAYVAAPRVVERVHGLPEWALAVLPSLVLLAILLALSRSVPLRRVRLRGAGSAASAAVVTLVAAAVTVFACVRDILPGAGPVNAGTVVGLVLLVPLAEELYFRGFLLDHLAHNLGRMAALGLSAFMFAGLHAPQGQFWLMLALGFLAGVAALATGSASWAVVVHLAWNGCAVIETSWDLAGRASVVAAVIVGLLALRVWDWKARESKDARPETDTVGPAA